MPGDSHVKIRTVPRRGIGPGEYERRLQRNQTAHRRWDLKKNPNRKRRGTKNHSETASTVFRCKTCGAEFDTPELLGAHWRAEHPEIFSEDWYQPRYWRKERTMKNDDKAACKFCGREGTWSSIRVHQALCPKNPDRKERGKRKNGRLTVVPKANAIGRLAPLKEDIPIEIARGLVNDALDLLAATRKAGITITAQK